VGLFRREKPEKQEDRAARYTVKLRRGTYAKLGLISERLGASEQDTLDGIIDFALASYGSPSKPSSGVNNLDLAGIITGEAKEDPDLLSQLAVQILPQLLKGGLGKPNTTAGSGGAEPNSSSPDLDIKKALDGLGL